jgi:putative flippase GtrA
VRLAILYSLFAAFATGANLAAQAGVHALLPFGTEKPGPVYWLALCVGTGTGLIVKYLLDKRWIFDDRTGGVAAHSRKFSLYTLMGLATTAIFWGVQTGFVLIWQSQAMLYLGGAVGLAIGYILKYRLDKRFVFVTRTAVA